MVSICRFAANGMITDRMRFKSTEKNELRSVNALPVFCSKTLRGDPFLRYND